MTAHPFVDLAAALALLLCGLAVLRSSFADVVERQLLPVLLRASTSRARIFAAGAAIGVAVRHGTVLPRLLGPAMERGSLLPGAALVALLAAGAGAGFVTLALAADPQGAYQALLVAGALLALAGKPGLGATGRALFGAALALMALRLLGALAEAPDAAVATVTDTLAHDILLAATLGAMATLLLRTSMATVLLAGVLCAAQLLSAGAAFAIMLGANLGSTLMTWTGAAAGDARARQVAAAALLVRTAAVACALLLHEPLAASIARSPEPALALAASHLLFNVAAALLASGFTRPLLAAMERWLPTGGAATHRERLEPGAAPTTLPSVALASATREVVRLADLVETMLRGMLQVFLRGDATLARSVRNMDDAVDRCYADVKHYLAGVRRMQLAPEEARRWHELMTFAIALEQAADGAERVLDDIARRAPAFSATFPAPAVAEICSLHTILMHNARLAVMLLLRRDDGVARELVTAHAAFVDTLRMYQAAHLQRLSAQEPASAAVSALYLDLLGDFARLNSLVCSLADAFLPLQERLSGFPAAAGAPAWRGAMPLLQEAK